MKPFDSTALYRTALQLLFTAMFLYTATPQASGKYAARLFNEREQIATALRWMEVNPLLGRSEDADQIAAEIVDIERTEPAGQTVLPGVELAPTAGLGELPFAVVGKLFFRKPDGRPAACSAGFAGDDDILVTAAHCLMQRDGSWNSDVLFYHLFGTEAMEVYEIQCMATTDQWRSLRGGKQLAYDFGFLKTGRKSNRGSLGVSTGLPAEYLRLVGYADRHHGGRKMVTATVASSYSNSGLLVTMNNDMGHGSSGSPWTAMGAVYSVSSFFTPDQPDVMWGPRFTSETVELLNYVRRGCQS